MSDIGFTWGGEHFCKPDATELYYSDPQRLSNHGFPVELDTAPEPETFCSVCLLWFSDPAQHEGTAHRAPEQEGQA